MYCRLIVGLLLLPALSVGGCGSDAGPGAVGSGDEVGVWCRPGYYSQTEYLVMKDGKYTMFRGTDSSRGGNYWLNEVDSGTELAMSCQNGCNSKTMTDKLGYTERHDVIEWVKGQYFVVFDKTYNQYEHYYWLADYNADDMTRFALEGFDPTAFPECSPVAVAADGPSMGRLMFESTCSSADCEDVPVHSILAPRIDQGLMAVSAITSMGASGSSWTMAKYETRTKFTLDGVHWESGSAPLKPSGSEPMSWMSPIYFKAVPEYGALCLPASSNVSSGALLYGELENKWTEVPRTVCPEASTKTVDEESVYNPKTNSYYSFCVQLQGTFFYMKDEPSLVFHEKSTSSSIWAVLDPSQGENGTVHALLDPLLNSEGLHLFSRHDEPATNHLAEWSLTVVDPLCGSGCYVKRAMAYQVKDGLHHMVAEVYAPEVQKTAYVYLHGSPEQGFSSRLLNPEVAEGQFTDYGDFVGLQVDAGPQKEVAAFFHNGHCLTVMHAGSDGSDWSVAGTVTSLAQPKFGAVHMWPDGKVGFLSGNQLVYYYHSDLVQAGPACGLSAVALPQAPDYGTEKNLIQIELMPSNGVSISITPQVGVVNPICSVEMRSMTNLVGLMWGSQEAKAFNCGDPTNTTLELNLGSETRYHAITFTFNDQNQILPFEQYSVQIPAADPILKRIEELQIEMEKTWVPGQDWPVTWVPAGASSVAVSLTPTEGDGSVILFEDITNDNGNHIIPSTALSEIDESSVLVRLEFRFDSEFNFPVAEGSYVRFAPGKAVGPLVLKVEE